MYYRALEELYHLARSQRKVLLLQGAPPPQQLAHEGEQHVLLQGVRGPGAAVGTPDDIVFVATGDPRQQNNILGGGIRLAFPHSTSTRADKDYLKDDR